MNKTKKANNTLASNYNEQEKTVMEIDAAFDKLQIKFITFAITISILTAAFIFSLPYQHIPQLLLTVMVVLAIFYIGNHWIKKSVRNIFIDFILKNKKSRESNQRLKKHIKNRTVQLKKSLALIKHQATHDFFTDLPNHLLLEKHIKSALKSAKKNSQKFAIIYFSLNEIEKINRGLGHQASLVVMRTISDRLKNIFNSNNLTGKLFRTHEFVILLSPVDDIAFVETVAEKIFSLFETTVNVEEHLLKLTGSIGIVLYPNHGKNIKSLLMNADAARLHATERGGNKIEIYNSEINLETFRHLSIESHLHEVIKNNELRLLYQPFMDLKTHKICGMEALIRWKNPVLGIVLPSEFIPLAEANGMILALGEWVLRTACAQIKVWHEQGFCNLKLAVNLSAKQLHQKNIVQMVIQILEEVNLMPKYLELELTETEVFKNELIPIVQQFKSIGLHLSVDDFGTGHSGLKNLKTFKIDKLKIDKAFVQDIDHNQNSKVIVANTIALAKKLNIQVLAEGVETKEQLEFLRNHGCDMIQGYYCSPPVSADEFTELLINEK